MNLAWDAMTHRGQRRASNEDAIVANPPMFAVADGMGGHKHGNVASSMAAGAIHEIGSVPNVTRSAVLEKIRGVDRAIAERGIELGGDMGTTLSGLAALDDHESGARLLVFNVGDSRSYRLRDRDLVQLTTDHSVVQELIDSGRITEAEAEQHPERNVITRSLGHGGALEIDWWFTTPRSGDRYLVCSDGLYREVPADQIAAILGSSADPPEAVNRLLDTALAAGGRDNIAIVVVEVIDVDAMQMSPDSLSDLDADTQPRGHDLEVDTSEPVAHVSRPPIDG